MVFRGERLLSVVRIDDVDEAIEADAERAVVVGVGVVSRRKR